MKKYRIRKGSIAWHAKELGIILAGGIYIVGLYMIIS